MEINEESIFFKQKILNEQEKSIIKAYYLCQKRKQDYETNLESNIDIATI
jgi:hypothetical protein